MSDKTIEIYPALEEKISPELEHRMRIFANVLIDRILGDKTKQNLKSTQKDSNLPPNQNYE